MCGLGGSAAIGPRKDLERMTAALIHRGPDGDGFFIDEAEQIFLGHRGLAVIDVASGRQPMWKEDGQVAVVFNAGVR
jgi:asparagine synthase (glutamine-hydrolysing)